MIRVAFVLQEPTPYRSPHLARIAARPELDVHIAYAARTVQRRTWTVADETAVYLGGRSLPLGRLLHHDYPLTLSVWPWLERLRPDVVVVGGWSTSATQLAILWCRRRGVPYVLMSDNHLLEPRPAWVRAVKRIVLGRIVPQAAGWLVPGRLARDHIVHYGAETHGIVELPLTVDVEALERRADELEPRRAEIRARLGVEPDAVMVLSVGRLIGFKGLDVLVRAVAAGTSSTPLHLVVAGSGPLEAEVRAEIARHGVTATMVGFVEGEALHELYAAADVFALLSRREPWGVVVNEAMAFGLPLLLSYAIGAAADLLVEGRNGFRVPAEDVGAAAAALDRLAADPALRRELGSVSRSRVKAWGYERGADDLVRLLQRVTFARRPRRTSRDAGR